MKILSAAAILALATLSAFRGQRGGLVPLARTGPERHFQGDGLAGAVARRGAETALEGIASGTGFASFSVSEGRVYTMGNANNTDSACCLDARTGKVIWRIPIPARSTPRTSKAGPARRPRWRMAASIRSAGKGICSAWTRPRGRVIWSKNLNRDLGLEIPTWGCASSALVEGNLVVVNMGSAGVALDRKSGKVVWVSAKSAGAYATPVPLKIGAERCLAILSRQSLVAVKAASGQAIVELSVEDRVRCECRRPDHGR